MGSIEDTASRMIAPRSPNREAGTAYLLVVDWDEETELFSKMSVVPLPRDGTIVIGRSSSEGADVVLKHRSVSKRHTSIRVDGGAIRVSDLGSRNGTFINKERVHDSRTASSGDLISVGDVTVVLHQSVSVTTRATLVEADWKRRLAEEIERAVTYGRSLAILALTGVPASVVAGLGDALKLIDVVGAGESGTTLLLLPEVTREQARVTARAVVQAVKGQAAGVRCGLALCPSDACDPQSLLLAARSAARKAQPGTFSEATEPVRTIELGDKRVLVADPAMDEIFTKIERLAPSQLPILINGETGVGKENAAYAVHHWSKRSGPFIAKNCGAITESLAEAELFGHDKGAFTGAATAKPGLFEAADGGTLFLDEIGDLPVPIQIKLLRVIETKTVTRVGETRERKVDVRLVSATWRNLEVEIAEGRFRRDLQQRISTATVILPPLRDRRCEIPMLARAFLAEFCAAADKKLKDISPAVMQALLTYDWIGNVRELRGAMEYACANSVDDLIELEDIAEKLGATTPAAPTAPKTPTGEIPPITDGFRPIADELRDLEKQRMTEALATVGGVKSKAAQLIGMPMRTFTLKSKQYGL